MAKAFSDVLRDINAGKFVEELTEEFASLVGDCNGVGKGGSITITLKLKPGKGGGVMQVEHDFKVKSPQFDRPTDDMFVDKDNALVRDNPRQSGLDLKVVDKETGEIVTIPRETARDAAAA